MANVKMEELARVQTVGPGGIGVYPPVPTEKVDKVSSAGLGEEELQRSANVLPHPGAVDDGAVMQEIDGVWSGGQGGGGGSADIDLGVTDASVGDYLKVKSVDEDGKPIAWESEPVDTEAIVEATDAWLEENVAQETGYVLDSTLTMSNAAAPADKVGELKESIINTAPSIINATSSNPVNIKDGAENKKIRKIDVTVKEGAGTTGIITRYGKNLFRIPAENHSLNSVTLSPTSDGGLHIYGKSTSQSGFILARITSPINEVVFPKGVFSISQEGGIQTYIQVVPYSGSILYCALGTGINNYTYSNDISIRYFDIGIKPTAYNIDIDMTIYPMLCYDIFDSTFEKYSSEQITIDIPTGSNLITIENAITTLKGNNTIISNFGNIDNLEYSADTKLYIDSKIAELQASMLENIGG